MSSVEFNPLSGNFDLVGSTAAGTWKPAVANAAALPLTGNSVGDARVAEDTGIIYVWTGASWDTAVAGVGTVTSVGLSAPSILTVGGSPVTGAGTLTLTLADQPAATVLAGPTSGPDTTPTFRALQMSDLPTASFNTFAGFDGSGVLESVPGFNIDTTSGGMSVNLTEQPNNNPSGAAVHSTYIAFDPLQNSPNEGWNINSNFVDLDVNSSGFNMGTNGSAINLHTGNIKHFGTGSTGNLTFISNNFELGNGTDPVTIEGISYAFGFGSVAAGVTMDGPIQGWGFQPNFNAAATLTTNAYVQAFYDAPNINCTLNGSYQGFNSSPTIAAIANNSNYTGLNINANITTLQGNAGISGVGVFPTVGTINSGSLNGVNVNPTVTQNKGYVAGINVNMSSVTNYAGVKSSLVVQDITYEFLSVGDNDTYSMEYVDDVTAGSEYFSILGQAITCHIESGVSTATQIAAAAAVPPMVTAIATTITGVASNAQVTAAVTNFTGGENAGTKQAANFIGDVAITGSLSFTGALNIGQLTSYAPFTVTSGLGVASVDSLITAPNVAANATITGTDLLAVNTAMLLTIGDNASVTSSFLGYAALGLPAVLSMGTGSTIDLVEGAVFAVSLDAGATGGTAAELKLCRSIAIPNGVTTVTRLVGYSFDLPFGDPGTTTWGLYSSPATAHNYMAGDLIIGTSDTPTNSSVAFEVNSTTKAVVDPRMTTTERDALTAFNGMRVYNTTTDKFQGYAAGSWVDFH